MMTLLALLAAVATLITILGFGWWDAICYLFRHAFRDIGLLAIALLPLLGGCHSYQLPWNWRFPDFTQHSLSARPLDSSGKVVAIHSSVYIVVPLDDADLPLPLHRFEQLVDMLGPRGAELVARAIRTGPYAGRRCAFLVVGRDDDWRPVAICVSGPFAQVGF